MKSLFLAFALAAVFPAVCAALAWRYFCPTPLVDGWDALLQLTAVRGHGWGAHLAWWWKPFVDQRIPMMLASIDVLDKLFGDGRYPVEIALGFLAQLGLLAAAGGFVRRGDDAAESDKPALLAVCSALLFWVAGLERFQNHWYSTEYAWSVAPGAAAILLLSRRWGRWSGLALAAVCAAVAAGGQGTGALLLPAIGVALLCSDEWSREQKAAWWSFCLLAWALIARGLPSREALGFPPLLERQGRDLRYFLQCFTPVAGGPAAGLALLALVVERARVLGRRALSRENAPWTIAALWGVSVAAATTIARANFEPAPKSVYICFFALFDCAAAQAAFALSAVEGHPLWKLRRNAPALSLALLAAGAVYARGCYVGARLARRYHEDSTWVRCALRFQPLLTDADIKPIYPHPLVSRLPILARAGKLKDWLDVSPLSPVPDHIRFKVQIGPGVQPTREGFLFRASDPSAFAEIEPSRPLRRSEAVALSVAPDGYSEGVVSWDYGADDWSPSRLLPHEPSNGSNWLFFCPDDRSDGAAITRFRLKFLERRDQPAVYLLRPRLSVWSR